MCMCVYTPLEGSEQQNDFPVYMLEDHQLLRGLRRVKAEPLRKPFPQSLQKATTIVTRALGVETREDGKTGDGCWNATHSPVPTGCERRGEQREQGRR